jgi:hypothetical protein
MPNELLPESSMILQILKTCLSDIASPLALAAPALPLQHSALTCCNLRAATYANDY